MNNREKQIEEMAMLISKFGYCMGSPCSECQSVKHKNCSNYDIAKKLYDNNYRKMDEVTLKLDLGDRTPEEIKQIAEVFNGEIKKQVAKEIFEELRANEEANPEDCDCWLVAVEGEKFIKIAKKYGVEIEQ